MKGNKHLFIFSLFIYFLLTKNVFAACDYETQVNLAREAASIKLSYEESGTYLNLIFDTIPNTLYMVFEDGNEVKVNGNGLKQDYLWTKTDEPTNLRFDIYASSATSCPGEFVTTTYLSLPMYNRYSTRDECSNSTLYVCNKFTSTYIDDASFKNAFNKVSTIDVKDEEVTPKKKNKDGKVVSFVKDNKLYIIAFGSLIVFGTLTGIVLYKKKNRIF